MVDWFSVLTDYGIDVPNTNQFIIHCPFHEVRRQSCSINLDKGVWICFAGCGQGSLKYFIYNYTGKPWKELDTELEEKTWELDLSLFEDEIKVEDLEDKPVKEPENLKDVPTNHWIYKRGFSRDCVAQWGCKSNNYDDFLIPVENTKDEILGWINRRRAAIPKYLFSYGFAKSHSLFGINQIYSAETLFVVEGALDCMWLQQNGYSAVAILGASISPTQMDLISSLHPDEVVLALDNDEAGQKGISKATVDMSKRFMLSYLQLPKKYKDVQEIQDIKVLNNVITNNKTIF